MTDALVRTWVERCRDGGLGLVAVVDDGEPSSRVVADAGYVLRPNGDGEFALTVAADRRGWLGPYLLDVLVEAAAERGVRNLEADILTENRVMLSLVRRRGYVTDGDTDFLVVHVVIGTEGHGPVWPSGAAGTQLLVEQPGGRWEGRKRALHAGFDVLVCGFREDCPALQGRPCPLADEADAIVVAFPAATPGAASCAERTSACTAVFRSSSPPPRPGELAKPAASSVSGSPSAALRAQLAEALGGTDQPAAFEGSTLPARGPDRRATGPWSRPLGRFDPRPPHVAEGG